MKKSYNIINILKEDDGMRVDRQSCIENIGRICAEYASILGRVILFGSVARSENTETSDIDLYVEPRDLAMTSGKLEKNKAYREFRLKLFDLYDGKVDYDILSFGSKRDLQNMKGTVLWNQIERDGVILYDGRAEKV